MDSASTPSRCHVNLSALQRNFGRLGDAARLMPVIKCDAYGHGLLQAGGALNAAGARYFAVNTLAEARALRKAGLRQTIVPLMGCLDADEWDQALALGIMPLIRDFADLASLSARLDSRASVAVALKFDTGMGRLGFAPEQLVEVLEALARLPALVPQLALTHLACADEPGGAAYTRRQLDAFAGIRSALSARWPAMLFSHANSAATLAGAPDERELVRPGLALYGGNPCPALFPDAVGLEWVMSVCAPVLQVKDLAAGQSVSYGCIFTAQRPMKIAVIGAGYATGLARALSGRCSLLIGGRRVPQVGRICMSLLMADISRVPDTRPGDLAWLMGGTPLPGEKAVSAQELADKLGTIPYEVLCLMGSASPRIHHGGEWAAQALTGP